MTTTPLATYQAEDGNRFSLSLSEDETSYLYHENGRLKSRHNRFSLPWNTNLPGLDAESFLFTLMPQNQGLSGLRQGIQQIKEGKNLVVYQTLTAKELRDAYPEAFEPGVETLDFLVNQLFSPLYHYLIYKLMPDETFKVRLVVKGTLSDWIPLDAWMFLYESLVIALNPKTPEINLAQWEWLHSQEVQHLFLVYCLLSPDLSGYDPYFNLTALSSTLQDRFQALENEVLDFLMSEILEGFPMDVTLDSCFISL